MEVFQEDTSQMKPFLFFWLCNLCVKCCSVENKQTNKKKERNQTVYSCFITVLRPILTLHSKVQHIVLYYGNPPNPLRFPIIDFLPERFTLLSIDVVAKCQVGKSVALFWCRASGMRFKGAAVDQVGTRTPICHFQWVGAFTKNCGGIFLTNQ